MSSVIVPGTARLTLRRSLLWAASTIAAGLVVTEIALRTVFGLGGPIIIQSDPAAGYVLVPSQNVHRFFVHTFINSKSMRSDEPTPKLTGTFRILFVGDSITYGSTQVDQREIFSERVRRDLHEQLRHPVEVQNAAVSAWAPQNELKFVQSRGIVNSDLVVWVWNDGDINQPMTTMKSVGDELPSRPFASALGEGWFLLIQARFKFPQRRVDAGSASQDTFVMGDVENSNLSLIPAMKRLVESQSGKLAIAFVPLGESLRQPALGAKFAAIAAVGKRLSIPTLDLSRELGQYKKQSILLVDGTHYNSEGHRAIARALEQKLTEANPPVF